MSTVLAVYQRNKSYICFGVGLLAATILILPYLLLGEGAYIPVHDQADGELLNYIYRAKYLWQGTTVPEFMNGMEKVSMVTPAPLGIFIYKFFSPYTAYVIIQAFVIYVGFVGMYLLCKELKLLEEIGTIVAILFCYMPFYPAHGLVILGQPILIWSFLQLWKGKNRWQASILIFLVAGFSSVILLGYAAISFAGLVTVVAAFKYRAHFKNMLWGTFVLLATYVGTSTSILQSVFLPSDFISHREEMVIRPLEDWLGGFKEMFIVGSAYSRFYSELLILFTIAILIGYLLVRKEDSFHQIRKYSILLFSIMGFMLFFALLALAWKTVLVAPRIYLGGIFQYFQADRITWCFYSLWTLAMALIIQIVYLYMEKCKHIFIKSCFITGMVLLVLVQGLQVLRDSTLNKNARLMFFDTYEQMTWEGIFMEDVFDEIKEQIGDVEGYSVASLGMYSTIPLYNGFTCADGYSSNYHLDYKHQFRKIIADELEESIEAKTYFDDWGHRAYLVDGETGFNAVVSKHSNMVYEDLNFNIEAMKEFHIRYIFSAAPIEGAFLDNLALIEGSPFSSDTSYYEVWVYEIL